MSLNLLPWRAQQHRRNLRRSALCYAAFLFLAALLWPALWQGEQHQQQALDHQQQEFAQQNAQLQAVTTQIEKLRAAMKNSDETLSPLASEQVLTRLQGLSELPLEQGELRFFQMEHNQMQFEGDALNQTEFEAVHRFLNGHFPHVTLSQFQPTAEQLHFRFDINIQGATQ